MASSSAVKLDDTALNRVGSLSKKAQFFVWMHTPGDFITLDEVLALRKEFNISSSVVINKIIYNLVSNGFTSDQIIEFLQKENILMIYNPQKIKKIISDCFEISHKPITSEEIDYVISMENTVKKLATAGDSSSASLEYEKSKHSGYPIPHPTMGRPHLEWNKCYHEDCHHGFSSTESLKNHLEKQGRITHGLHKFHEDYVKLYGLTPTIVKDKKLTKCPSWVCDKSDETMTPDELCEHFKVLGIYPFWQPEMIIAPKKTAKVVNKEKLDKDVYNSLFVNSSCLICLDEDPQVIFLPCNHHATCFSCSTSFSICPVCRTKITSKLPF